MRKTFVLTSLALVLALVAPLCVRAQRGVRLVETGGFHGDEVSARTGETWLGLYVSEGRSALVPSVLKVEPVHDEVVDEEEGQMTGKAVSVKGKSHPLFLVAGADALKPGPVVTTRAQEFVLTDKSDVRLTLAGEAYRLRVESKKRSGNTAMFFDDARLVLSKGKVSQSLYDLRSEGDRLDDGGARETVEWKLLWAGDLDGDRRLDLYVQVSWHYNIIQRKLFLSSGAKRLVREAAELSTSGC